MKTTTFLLLLAILMVALVRATHVLDLDNEFCSKDAGSPRITFTPDNPCDSRTNCFFGGECMQLPDVDNNKSLVRYNLTLDIEKGLDSNELHAKERTPYAGGILNNDDNVQFATQKCVCNHKCWLEPDIAVCGTDRETYSNKCWLELEACRCQKPLYMQYHGGCITTQNYEPIDSEDAYWSSGSGDGNRDFANVCSSGTICRYGAVCEDDGMTCKCLKVCPPPLFEERALGSDGVWYQSICLLHQAECEQQIAIDHVKDTNSFTFEDSEIDDKTTTPTDPCDGILCFHGAICLPNVEHDFTCSCEAICDQEFASPLPEEENQNSFMAAFFMEPRTMMFAPPLTKVEEDGEIPQIDDIDIYPLDGSDIQWQDPTDEIPKDFGNKKSKQKQRKRRNRRVHNDFDKTGFARVRRSSPTYPRTYINKTVCGTDGKTYAHECRLRVRACQDKIRIDLAHVGACKMKPLLITQTTTPITNEKSTETSSSSTATQQTTTMNFVSSTMKNIYMDEIESKDGNEDSDDHKEENSLFQDVMLETSPAFDSALNENRETNNKLDEATPPLVGVSVLHDEVHSSSITTTSLHPVTPKSLYGDATATGSQTIMIAMLVGVGQILLLSIIVTVLCIKCKRNSLKAEGDEERNKAEGENVCKSSNKQKVVHFVKSTC